MAEQNKPQPPPSEEKKDTKKSSQPDEYLNSVFLLPHSLCALFFEKRK
jgi:hypothetical protein